MMYLYGKRQECSLIFRDEFPECNLRYRILSSPVPRMRKTCKRYPGQRREVDPIVTRIRPERPITRQHFLHSAFRLVHKFLEVCFVLKICKSEVLIRQQHAGTAVDYVVDNHLSFSETIAEGL